jgi:hypothetical protein
MSSLSPILTTFVPPFCWRYPRSVNKPAARQKAISYVQPSGFDILAGERPASARDGWAE